MFASWCTCAATEVRTSRLEHTAFLVRAGRFAHSIVHRHEFGVETYSQLLRVDSDDEAVIQAASAKVPVCAKRTSTYSRGAYAAAPSTQRLIRPLRWAMIQSFQMGLALSHSPAR